MVIKKPLFKIVWLHLFFAQKFNRKLPPNKSEKQRKRSSKYLKNTDVHFFFFASYVFTETLRGADVGDQLQTVQRGPPENSRYPGGPLCACKCFRTFTFHTSFRRLRWEIVKSTLQIGKKNDYTRYCVCASIKINYIFVKNNFFCR